MSNFDVPYQNLIKKILQEGIEQTNERTGHKTLSLFGENLVFNLEDGFPILTLRKIPLKIFIAEQIWFISGSNKPSDFLHEHTKIWDDFIEEDGTVAAAYGYRWRSHFGRDQLKQLITHLKHQPNSRQGVVMMWDPSDDGLTGPDCIGTCKMNVPCPFCFVVNIINNKLNTHLFIRSNDMILGSPHDIAGFSLLSYILAAKLGIQPGKLVVSISNAHIYDIHYEAAKKIISRETRHPNIKFAAKADYFERAEKKDHSLVEEIYDKLSHQYRPQKTIKGLKIVL
ncbi:MAG: thymidylate synthase [Patescibacteria group bacterium]